MFAVGLRRKDHKERKGCRKGQEKFYLYHLIIVRENIQDYKGHL
jgi:hypothetical protein